MSNALLGVIVFTACLVMLAGKLLFDMYLGSGRRGSAESPVAARNRLRRYYAQTEAAEKAD